MKPLPRPSRLPAGTGGASPLSARGLLALLLLASVTAARAEELLTRVLYTEGTASYTLLNDNGTPASEKETTLANILRPTMSLPALAQVDTTADAKILISPIPEIKYVVYPKSRIVNEALSYHEDDSDHTIDYRLRVVRGIIVGDVQNLPHNVGNEIETSLGRASTPNGHFLVAVKPDGSTKFGVLTGSLTVNLTGRGTYTLVANQVLNVLSEGAKEAILANHQGEIPGGSPADVERQEGVALLNEGGEDLKITSLQSDPEALALLTEPMPEPDSDSFSNPPTVPQLVLLPGQESPFFNPGDYFFYTTPPVSPILP